VDAGLIKTVEQSTTQISNYMLCHLWLFVEYQSKVYRWFYSKAVYRGQICGEM